MRKKSPSAMSVFSAKLNKARKLIRVMDFSEKVLDKQPKIQVGYLRKTWKKYGNFKNTQSRNYGHSIFWLAVAGLDQGACQR